jgi:hypothetical protein
MAVDPDLAAAVALSSLLNRDQWSRPERSNGLAPGPRDEV